MKDKRLWRGKHIFAVWLILTLGCWVLELNGQGLDISKTTDLSLATYWFYLLTYSFSFYMARYGFRYLFGPQARLYPMDTCILLCVGFACYLSIVHGQQLLPTPPLLAIAAVTLTYLYFDCHRQRSGQDSDLETNKPEDE